MRNRRLLSVSLAAISLAPIGATSAVAEPIFPFDVHQTTLDNGLLHINLARPKAVKSVRTIEIKSAGSRANGAGAETIDVTPER